MVFILNEYLLVSKLYELMIKATVRILYVYQQTSEEFLKTVHSTFCRIIKL